MIKRMKIKQQLSKYFHFPRTPILKLLIVIHAWFLLEYHAYYEWSFWKTEPLQTIGMIGYSYWSIITLYYLVETLLAPYRWRRYFGIITLLFVYSLGVGYFFESDMFFEYGLLHDTQNDAKNWGGIGIVFSRIQYETMIYSTIVILGLFIQECRKQWIKHHAVALHKRWVQLATLVGLCAIFILNPIRTHDVITFFMQSAYRYFYPDYSIHTLENTNTYPYLQETFSYTSIKQPASKPHVFLIILESFNADAVRMKNDRGQLIMPFFNQLKTQGFYVKHYYSNSVLSAKGYGSILYSLYPMYKGSLLSQDTLTPYGLHNIFKHNGYSLMGIFSEKSYQNLFSEKGFDDAYLVDHPVDDVFKNDWGVEDRFLYQSLFRRLDEKQETGTLNQPVFNLVITLYSHTSFNVPEERRYHYKTPQTLDQKYKNSFALSDEGLAYFFDELKKRDYLDNSVVIIVGDHGYPLGNHGITKTETGIYDESYRVPFLMLWPNQLPPTRIKPEDNVYSHVDVAPTLIDLLHLEVDQTAFVGQSMLKTNKNPTLLIQPYGGYHFQSIRYPYKYRKHISMNREFVYDLSKDPLENTSIINDIDPVLLHQFRNDIMTLFENQILLETNRIYPNTQSK